MKITMILNEKTYVPSLSFILKEHLDYCFNDGKWVADDLNDKIGEPIDVELGDIEIDFEAFESNLKNSNIDLTIIKE